MPNMEEQLDDTMLLPGIDRERELAHILLVELLAHQFAMPVRWIETQETLLVDKKAERVIEVGPAPVLNNMMSKTIQQFHAERDAATSIKRQMYCIAKDYQDIYYDGGEAEGAAIEAVPVPQAVEAPPIVIAAQETLPSVRQEALPDRPVSATEALLALVGSNLKMSPVDLGPDETISGLAKGKSNVQNELVGDILAEFGAVPEGVEQMALHGVAASIGRDYRGVLGKSLSPRVSKMFASKFPASVDTSSTRARLLSHWGLQAGRQDAALLLMMSRQPTSRISEASQALEFVDGVAKEYMTLHQLQVPAAQTQAGDRTSGLALGRQAADVIRQMQGERDAILHNIAASVTAGTRQGEEVKEKPASAHQAELLCQAQAELDGHSSELGDEYLDNIRGKFHPTKCRSYDSVWNWVAIDLMELYHRLRRGDWLPTFQETERTRAQFANRWDDRLTAMRSYFSQQLDRVAPQSAVIFRQLLDFDSDEVKNKTVSKPAPPCLDTDSSASHILSVKPAKPVSLTTHFSERKKKKSVGKRDMEPFLTMCSKTPDPTLTRPRRCSLRQVHDRVDVMRRREGSMVWRHDAELSRRLTPFRSASLHKRHAFAGKTALITGAGPNSIALGIVPGLLQGGARVVLTTSRPLAECAHVYQSLFTRYGGFGSRLVLVPFNQASKNDVARLLDYIYDPVSAGGLGEDLDYIVPFAAIPQNGRGVDEIDAKAELAHRAMSTNVLRLLGAVKASKAARGIVTRPAQVMLPLSPNMGTFGNDGLYGESKASLVVLLNKWLSEGWAEYLSLCGVLIGWTTGTGLMAGNDELASAMREEKGVTIFSQTRMAQYILRLMSDPFVGVCQNQCLLVNLSGGLEAIDNMGKLAASIRSSIREQTTLSRAIESEMTLDDISQRGTSSASRKAQLSAIKPRINLKLPFPKLPDLDRVQHLRTQLEGMVDLSSTVVICGFAEVGPLGNARTRWQREVSTKLSPDACLELAWMTGLITYGLADAGWLDVQMGEAVQDWEIQERYESILLEHTGLRLIDPKDMDPPTRDRTQTMQEILIQQDLKPFRTTRENALEFAAGQEFKVDISPIDGTDEYTVHLQTGARIFVPKAASFERIVGGQLPQGWDPRVYGLPEDICDSVDECTVMALVCAAEALLSAGITDVYDLYKHMHISDLANCVGSGAGGLASSQKLFRERFLDRDVQSDILAETFINTTAAWVNMLLTGSSGPIKTPVGACATALESLNQGYDLITSGEAKVCLVGGVDSMVHDTSDGFARMNATMDTNADMRAGRSAAESSRPTTTTRGGFVESEGCGIQVLASAQVALDLGLPIWAVVADVRMASDGTGKSVPAPGQGLLANVRSTPNPGQPLCPSPLLSIDYRKRALDQRLSMVRQTRSLATEHLLQQYGVSHVDELPRDGEAAELLLDMDLAMQRDTRLARQALGNSFWTHDSRISPLRGALAVWNLTIDDLAVVSMHGTSTKANEKNECEVLHRQFEHLGRAHGNPALVVCQKYLTGHPKAAAAAWMLNGCCQMMDAGLVPGNRNADNVDQELNK